MMTYEAFMREVEGKFADFFFGQCRGMKVSIVPVKKVNCTLDGIKLVGENVSPTIYVNHMYEKYVENGDLRGTLEAAAAAMEKAAQECPQIPSVDAKNAKDYIVFQLVNTEQNREMLESMPHREFQDLSIIYRWVVKVDQDGIHSAKVDDRLAKQFGFGEEQLFEFAAKNTRRIFPISMKTLNEMLSGISGIPVEQIPDPGIEVYVVSNDKGINGATAMLYVDVFYELSQKVGDDLYILPSSIHEVLAIPASYGEPEELARMVREINMGEVALEERLSNQVYCFNRELRSITFAVNTVDKRLDR